MLNGVNWLTFAGRDSTDFGVYISGDKTFNIPVRRYETITVPGRTGHLTIDEGAFDNIELLYDAFIVRDTDTNLRGLRNWLLLHGGTYQRLEDTYEPDCYRMAIFGGDIDVEMTERLKQARFTLRFDAKPQRFRKDGEKTITLTSTATVYNPELTTAKPILRVYGNGRVAIGTNGVTVASNPGYIDIDCEAEDCTYGATSANDKVTFDDIEVFPSFAAGTNTVTLGSGITRVIITPRWWRL